MEEWLSVISLVSSGQDSFCNWALSLLATHVLYFSKTKICERLLI